jgi:hypothetical protein
VQRLAWLDRLTVLLVIATGGGFLAAAYGGVAREEWGATLLYLVTALVTCLSILRYRHSIWRVEQARMIYAQAGLELHVMLSMLEVASGASLAAHQHDKQN